MKQARVLSSGSFLPGDPITNEELERLVGPLPEDILEGIQVKTRHWMIDPATGEHQIGNVEMATRATQNALDAAGVDAAEIDLVVVSSASPEYLLPPMSAFVQEALGLARCTSIDIRSGCAGYVEALDLARLYLERGLHTTAVVIGSEAISPLLVPVFLGKDPDRIRMRDRMNPYNFGDGAGALLLRAEDGDEGGVLGSSLACLGGEKKPGMQIIGAGTHEPIHVQLQAKNLVELKVDVVESGRFTPFVLTEALRETLDACGLEADAIDVCVIPEGNAGYMVEELEAAGLRTAEWVALQGRIFENLADVGATGSAAVPLAVDYGWKTGAISQGDMVMLLAIETSKWKYAGMVLPWTAPNPSA